MPGTAANPTASRLPTPRTTSGATATSFSKGERQSRPSSPESGLASSHYVLRKELWCFTENRISVRFENESQDSAGQWWRSHGNEHWEFDEHGLMRRRDASINDYRIDEGDRRIHARDPAS